MEASGAEDPISSLGCSSGALLSNRYNPIPRTGQPGANRARSCPWDQLSGQTFVSLFRFRVHLVHSRVATSSVASPERILLRLTQTSLEIKPKHIKWGQLGGFTQQCMFAPNLNAGVDTTCQAGLCIQSTSTARPLLWEVEKVLQSSVSISVSLR